MSRSPRKVLLLGLGNDILTDDAIGLNVVRELRQEFAHDDRVDVRETMEKILSAIPEGAALPFAGRLKNLSLAGGQPAGQPEAFDSKNEVEVALPTKQRFPEHAMSPVLVR